jgi:hypothetical protein
MASRTSPIPRASFVNGYVNMPAVLKSAVSKSAVTTKPVVGSAVSGLSASNTVRHRQPSPLFIVRSVALGSYRLSLMGAQAVLTGVSAVLRTLT